MNPLEQLDLQQLRRRTSAKWRVFGDDVLPLWVAEMDTPLAEPVAQVLTRAVEQGDTGYAAGTAYAEAARDFAARRWDWDGLAVERTSLVADVMTGVSAMLELVTGPGDAVVVNCPVYPPFYQFLDVLQRRVVEAPLTAEHRIDLDGLPAAFAEARRGGRRAAYLLCNPHNPTGTVHTADELTAVAALAADHGVRVGADEIHAPLVLPGASFTPYLSVPGAGQGFAVLSASKAWNLPGLKAALVVAGPDARADLDRLPLVVGHGASHLGVLAHTAAWRDGGAWLDDLLSGLDGNRSLLADLLARRLPGVTYHPGEGTYLAWLGCAALNLPDPAPGPAGATGAPDAPPLPGAADVFLRHGRVALSPGPPFGTGGADHVRLNFATSQAILTEAVDRMAVALAALS